MSNTKNDFKFWVPLEFSKAKNEQTGEEEMKMAGIASTSAKDSDDEELDPAGFDLSILKSHGVINWHHMQKTNPDAIIGEPTEGTKLTPKGLWLEARLYQDSALAKKVYQLAEVLKKNSKTRRLGFSIEGKKLAVDPNDPLKITKAKITGCAITYLPKNPTTFADIIKGVEVEEPVYEFDEEIEKSDLSIKNLNSLANGGMVKYLVNLTTKDGKTVKVTEDGEITVDLSKCMTTEPDSGGPLKKEHVDTGIKETSAMTKKPNQLTKAEAFDKIFSDFPDIDIQKAKQIFNTTTKITAMSKEKTTPPTKEEIEKAYDILGLKRESAADTLEKGEETEESEEPAKPAPKPAKKPVAAPAKTATITKSEEETEEEEEEEEEPAKPAKKDMNKAQTGDLMYFQKGDHYVAMRNSGGELQEVPDRIFAKTVNGYQEIVKSPMEKALEENMSKLLNGQGELQKAIGVVFGDMKGQIDALTKQVEGMGGQRDGRRSAATTTVKEKQFAGRTKEDIEKANKDGKVLSIRNRAAVLNVLEAAMYAPTQRGGGLDTGFEKAMTTFEASGQLSPAVAKRMETELGIFLVD